MKMPQVREIAKRHRITIAKTTKLQLIQAIQLAEGNFSCYASASEGECDQLSCVWRTDCFIASKPKLKIAQTKKNKPKKKSKASKKK